MFLWSWQDNRTRSVTGLRPAVRSFWPWLNSCRLPFRHTLRQSWGSSPLSNYTSGPICKHQEWPRPCPSVSALHLQNISDPTAREQWLPRTSPTTAAQHQRLPTLFRGIWITFIGDLCTSQRWNQADVPFWKYLCIIPATGIVITTCLSSYSRAIPRSVSSVFPLFLERINR